MAIPRRSTERRRRVLYQTHVASLSRRSASSRRGGRPQRAPRAPGRPFGSKVHRHLRGRWFALVPVSPLALGCVTLVLLGVPLLLLVLHHLAVTWPPLAGRPMLSAPWRLDRADSLGRWWSTVVCLLAAGVCFLIYGLRLHRRDDYRGHYQLWRWSLVVMLLASVSAVVPLLAGFGALLDLALGDRAVLSGARWLRIVIDVGGVLLAFRLTMELYRCRSALAMMAAAAALLTGHELAAWRLVEIDRGGLWSLLTAAPLLAASFFSVGATIYLRLLYRQALNLEENPTLAQRFQDWIDEWRERGDVDDLERRLAAATREFPAPAAATVSLRRPPQRDDSEELPEEEPWKDNRGEPRQRSKRADAASQAKPARWRAWLPFAKKREREDQKVTAVGDGQTHAVTSGEADAEERSNEPGGRRQRLRCWKRRRGNAERQTADAAAEPEEEAGGGEQPAASAESKPKRRWFGLRSAGKAPADVDGQASESARDAASDEDTGSPAPKRQRKKSPSQRKPWFSLRLSPQRNPLVAGEAAEVDADPSGAEGEEDAGHAKPRKPGWLSRWRARRQQATGAEAEESGPDEQADGSGSLPAGRRLVGRKPSRQTGDRPAADSDHAASRGSAPEPNAEDEELPDPDDIDWSSMNKAERRRMRKRLRRAGHAA